MISMYVCVRVSSRSMCVRSVIGMLLALARKKCSHSTQKRKQQQQHKIDTRRNFVLVQQLPELLHLAGFDAEYTEFALCSGARL